MSPPVFLSPLYPEGGFAGDKSGHLFTFSRRCYSVIPLSSTGGAVVEAAGPESSFLSKSLIFLSRCQRALVFSVFHDGIMYHGISCSESVSLVLSICSQTRFLVKFSKLFMNYVCSMALIFIFADFRCPFFCIFFACL